MSVISPLISDRLDGDEHGHADRKRVGHRPALANFDRTLDVRM